MQPRRNAEVAAEKSPPPSSDNNRLIQEVRELFRDAPEYAQRALEALGESIANAPPQTMKSAGRIGQRQGVVSELTVIAPFAKGGAKRLRKLLELIRGNVDATDRVGSVHDMRFVFIDNDTRLLFATAYDGDWDAYIDDFATKIPNELDVMLCALEGWPGIKSPNAKDMIAKYQVEAVAWYVASPNLTVAETRRLEKVDKALNEFLDKIS
jgi:hypothetical protein